MTASSTFKDRGMTPAGRWLGWFGVGGVVIVAMLLLTLFTPPAYGDLSRIGRLSDKDFGWRTQPPAVAKALIHSVPLDQADILVVGDSFSTSLRWQSELVRNGFRVSTIYWSQTGPLCKDFEEWTRRAGFRGRLVVLESVERLLGDRLKIDPACSTRPGDLVVRSTPSVEPIAAPPDFAFNLKDKLDSGLVTLMNTREARKSNGDAVFENVSRVRPVANGCRYFSHRLCDKAIFLVDDTETPALKSLDVEKMKAFSKDQVGIQFIWMVIPDKTTVYIEPSRIADFSRAFNDARLGPDLIAFAAEQRERILDFYLPNDTHLSMQGQLEVGRKMLEAVRGVLPSGGAQAPVTVSPRT
ncbi:MAG: hypothetical protein EOP71_05590 [Variovorax sp.]|jgi:hypothetical protein|nr:MAG: hypothetical protein EOP71_05590 [Variovorax sp.]